MINTSSSNNIHALVENCINTVQSEASLHKVNVCKFIESDIRITLYNENPPIKSLLINLLKRCIHSLNDGDLLLLIEESHLSPLLDQLTFTLRGVGQINESSLFAQIYPLVNPANIICDDEFSLSPTFHFERENNHGFILWFGIDTQDALKI